MEFFTPEFTPIAVIRQDGSVAILRYGVLARGSFLPKGAMWLDEMQGIWARPLLPELIEIEVKKAVPDYVSWKQISEDDLPERDDYRNALRDIDGKLQHDLATAKVLHRNIIRHERAAAFAKLDGDWMKAVAQNDVETIAAVEAKRQVWRDAPNDPRIDEANSIAELKTLKVV